MPLTLQAKLLRVIEDQTFRRLGGVKDIRLDLRVIAATNRNLRQAVQEGAFRQDLYFRLNVIQILIPPLRERKEDILPLAKLFVEQYNRKFRRGIEGLSGEAAALLLSHDWPGNVREVRNAIERAMILEEGPLIQPASLPVAISKSEHGEAPRGDQAPVVGDNMSLEENERFLLARALERTKHNQTQAAKLLHITRDTLRYKMKKFHLH
jgi:transcriptional regulator with PAS, ATPase and Fis domain